MDFYCQSMGIVNKIKQEDDYNANEINKIALVKLDHSYSYPNYYDNDCNSVNVEDVKISECDEYNSTTPTFDYTEDNKAAVKDEIQNIKYESCVDMDTLHQIVDLGSKIDSNTSTNATFGSPLKEIKDEQYIENGKQFKLTANTKECIKVEEDMLGFDIKAEEQDSTKLEMLTEVLDIKPDIDVSDNENSDARLHRAIKKKNGAKEHRAVHRKADKTVFICYRCNFIVHSKRDLIYHINAGDCSSKGCVKATPIVRKRLHQSNQYICRRCLRTFKSKVAFDDHLVKKHAELISSVSLKIHQCHHHHCSYRAAKLDNLAKHMKQHLNTRCVCIHCDKIFKSKRGLDDHVVRNHKEFIASVMSKIHQCKYCSYKTIISSALARHTMKHPESGCSITWSMCIHCDEIFKSKQGLDEHVIKEHKEFNTSVTSKIHKCKYCSYKTGTCSDLARHMKKHPESGCSIKRSMCIHCDGIFKSKGGLDDHAIKKNEEFMASVKSKIHQCKYCSYKTIKSCAFARHMTKHPESRCRFKWSMCIHCDEIFKTKKGLNDHVVKKHGEFIASIMSKIHQCKYCSYKTIISSDLARHMKKHPESGCSIKWSMCIHCDKVFKGKQALDDHVIRKHEEFIASVSSKIHQCTYCSYKTAISSHLTSHMTKHP